MKQASIFIVEDESIIAHDLRSLLKQSGYKVAGMAMSGRQALRGIARTRPDLVLMDILIQGSMNGIDAAAAVRDRFHIPVVYLTAYADVETLNHAKQTQPFGYITKPIGDPRELQANIEIALFKHAMDRRLLESEVWLSTTLHGIADGVVATDQQGRVRFMNQSAEALTGWGAEEAIGKSFHRIFRVFDGATGAPFEPALAPASRRASIVFPPATLLASRSGQRVPVGVSGAFIRDSARDFMGAVLLFRDISERIRHERALEQSQREWEITFDAIADWVTLVEVPSGTILRSNTASESLIGKTRDQVSGKNICLLAHGKPGSDPECPVVRMLKSGKRETGEMRFNGSQWFQVSADPVFDADGRIVRAVHIIRDVTESNALKTEAARKAHLTALGELAAGVAHEINNPIMGIINCAQLIEDKKERGLPIGDLPRRVVREGERIARIVKNLLSFARSDTGSREPADPRDILQEALSLMLHVMEREGIRIDVRSAESLPMVMVHRQQIQQVFMNLLSNARHALNRKTPSRKNAKQITIHFGTVSVGPRRRMRVTISDNGPGIPASIRGRIFDPFFTTKPRGEGTGLGLSISERIVKDHGGSLTLESVEGRYTRAIVDFPL